MAKRILVDAASPSCLLEETRKLDKHPNKLLEGLNRLRLNKVFCDVILCCEGQEFPCHRVVLASISSYFQAMFTSGMVESTQKRVNMDGVEPEVVHMLLSFAYTSEVSISTANVQALLAGANLMDVPDVREACCQFMYRHINVNNCVEINLLAEQYSCQELEKCSMDYILEYFSVLYKQEAFLSLSVDKVTEILSSDHLNVPEEDMVFDAALLWLNMCTDRRQTADKVLESIRVPLLSPSYLHTVMECLDEMKRSQDCQSFFSERYQTNQRLLSEAEDWGLGSYRDTAPPRRTTVIIAVSEEDYHPYAESFDPRTKLWKRVASDFPYHAGREPNVVTSDIGTVVYVSGTRSNGASKKMWRYDLQWNCWSKMAPMNEARYCHGLVMLEGCVFALGGRGSNHRWLKDSVERFDPATDTWQLMKSVHMPDFDSRGSALVALDGLIYVFGVRGSSAVSNKYNPTSGEWTAVPPMQIPRSSPAACTLHGKIYLIGGKNEAEAGTVEVECFDPESNQWTMCSPMQTKRYNPAAAVVDGTIYILGQKENIRSSHNPGPDLYVERYCAVTDRWESVVETRSRHSDHRCWSVRMRRDAASMATDRNADGVNEYCDYDQDDDDEDDE